MSSIARLFSAVLSAQFLFFSPVAASPLPAPQGGSFSQFGGVGAIIGTRVGGQAWNSAGGSANAEQSAIRQVAQSSWADQNPNAVFGGNAGTWNNDQPPPSIPQALII